MIFKIKIETRFVPMSNPSTPQSKTCQCSDVFYSRAGISRVFCNKSAEFANSVGLLMCESHAAFWDWDVPRIRDVSQVAIDKKDEPVKIEKKTIPEDVFAKLYFYTEYQLHPSDTHRLVIAGNQFIRCSDNVFNFLFRSILIYEISVDDPSTKGIWVSVGVKKMSTSFEGMDLKEISTHDILSSLYVADKDQDGLKDNPKFSCSKKHKLSKLLEEKGLSL